MKRRGIRSGRPLNLGVIATTMAADGINRTQLAKRLGVKPEAVTNTLRPGTRVSLERALDYAKALGLVLDDIVDLGYE